MKIKKLLSLLAAVTVAVTAFTGAMSVSAVEADGKIGDNLTWTLDSDGKLTISGEGEMASPEVIDVTQVNGFSSTGKAGLEKALETQLKDYTEIYTYKEHMEEIKEVVIGEGVTSIGFAAFYKMPNLETVVLPSTISEFKGIGYSCQVNSTDSHGHSPLDAYASMAFAECTKLKNLTLTEGMTAIGSIAFYGCTALESVRIPSTILPEDDDNKYADYYEGDYYEGGSTLKANFGWGPYSFTGCTSLKDITLPEGLNNIGGCAFENTAVENVVIPSTIETWVRTDTNNIPIPPEALNGVTSHSEIHSSAFANCKNLSSVTFSDGVKVVGELAFWGCPKLTRIAIPKSVAEMDYSFQYCTSLEEVYIGDGVQISNNKYFDKAFEYCTNLKKIEIPEGVAIDYTNARWCYGCNKLTDLYIHGRDYSYFPAGNDTSKIHCFPDTQTYKTALSNYAEDRIANISDDISTYLDIVKTRLETAKKYDEEKYTPESYAVLKALIEKAEKFDENSSVLDMQWTDADLRAAIKGLEKKPVDTPVNTPSNSQQQTPNKTTQQTPTTAKPTKSTRSAAQVKKDKSAAKKAMKQAKITKLTAKSKAKKKITVSWKKVKNAKGYQVQVSAKKNFKKVIYNKSLTKNKLTIKSSKIKSKKTYYVRVRAYATYKDANNATKKIYSKWVKKIRKVKAK